MTGSLFRSHVQYGHDVVNGNRVGSISMKNWCIILLSIIPSMLTGQWNVNQWTTSGYVATGFSYQRWSQEFVSEPVDQAVFPLTVFYPLPKRIYLSLSNSPGYAGYGETKLTGLSDTWMRITYVLPGEKFLANLDLGVPTGKTSLSPEEFGLSRILSENAYRFRLPSWGQGLNAKFGLAAAHAVHENVVLGAGVNVVLKQAYHPLEDGTLEYKPGDEFNLFLGFDIQLGESGRWNADFVYTLYGVDRLNGDEVFGSGNRMLFHSSLLLGVGDGFLTAWLRWRQKGKNETWMGTALEQESMNSNGNQLELDMVWEFYRQGDWRFSLLGEGRLYSKNDYGERGARIAGGGVGFVYRFRNHIHFRFNTKLLKGSLLAQQQIDISGFDVSGSIVFGL